MNLTINWESQIPSTSYNNNQDYFCLLQVSEEAGYVAAMFQTPLLAIMFALRVHDDLFHFAWSKEILSLVRLDLHGFLETDEQVIYLCVYLSSAGRLVHPELYNRHKKLSIMAVRTCNDDSLCTILFLTFMWVQCTLYGAHLLHLYVHLLDSA